MAQFDCLEKPLSIFFYKYGQFVSRHPLVFVAFPLLLTAALALGFLRVPENEITDATYLFTPVGAPSKFERAVIHEKWPIHDNNFIPGRAVTQARECQLIMKSRENANILRGEYAEAVDRLNKFIVNRIRIEYGGRTWRYKDLCLRWRDDGCHDNSHIGIIGDLFNSGINISFPSFRFGSHRIYLASSMGGVTLRHGQNGTLQIVGAEAWMLLYQLKFKPDNMSYISGLWEREFERQLLAYRDPYIELTFFHSQTLTEELKRNAEQLIPRFAASFIILVIFAILCSVTLIKGRFFVDWVVSKPVLASMGVLNAGMAVVSAIGLLNYLKMPFNDIVLVMPFMAVAIGVDNMFLMVAALRRTNRANSVEKRVGESLSDVAISISITALTDALSFGVGAITTIPAVQIFCVYTCVAIVLTFVYQLTFFLGLLVIQTKMEEKNRHCVFYARTVAPSAAGAFGWNTRFWMLGSRRDLSSDSVDSDANFNRSLPNVFFCDWFSPVLMNPIVKVMVILWLCVYLGFAVWGCTLLREGLEPINLLVKNSYAIPHYHALEEYFWRYGQQVQVVVNRAPDLSDPEKRLEIESMVQAFAYTDHTIGMEGIEFWMEEFKHFVEQEISLPPSTLNTAFYRLVNHFLNTHTYDRWSADIFWDENTTDEEGPKISAFRFMVGMRNFETTNAQRETTELLREVAGRYRHFNVTTFMPIWLFTDQYQLVLPNTIQNILIALACMLVIALLLIPQPLCALWVAVSIASIDVGVVGYMTLWGVNLDAISMITIIMSIGFSVDFSAHISYGYVISDEEDPAERVRMALGALGWPIVQGGLSTIFGVVVLSTVEAYMIVTFFKTVFLVITIGMIHGLIFLPVLLSIFVRGTCVGGKKPKKSTQKVGPIEKVVHSRGLNRVGTASPANSDDTVDVFPPYSPGGRYGIAMPKLRNRRATEECWVQPGNDLAHYQIPHDYTVPIPFNNSHPSQIHLVPSNNSVSQLHGASHPVLHNQLNGGGTVKNPIFYVSMNGVNSRPDHDGTGRVGMSPGEEIMGHQYLSPGRDQIYRPQTKHSEEKNKIKRYSADEGLSPSRNLDPSAHTQNRRHSSYEIGFPTRQLQPAPMQQPIYHQRLHEF